MYRARNEDVYQIKWAREQFFWARVTVSQPSLREQIRPKTTRTGRSAESSESGQTSIIFTILKWEDSDGRRSMSFENSNTHRHKCFSTLIVITMFHLKKHKTVDK